MLPRRIGLAFSFILGLMAGPAIAASTINTAVPAENSPLQSAPIRANFTNAANDINNILSGYAGTTAPVNPTRFQTWVNTSFVPYRVEIYDGSTWLVQGAVNTSTHAWTLPSQTLTGTTIITGAVTLVGTTLTGGTFVSPALTTPTATTVSTGDNSTAVATTAWVKLQGYGNGAVSSVFGRTGAVVAATNDYSFSQISGTATPGQLPIGNGLVSSGGNLNVTGAAGQILAGATPALTSNPALGTSSVAGSLTIWDGASNSSVTLQGIAISSAYNFNYPNDAGAAGKFLTSQGGGSTAMTWSDPLAAIAANSVLGNATGGSAVPTALSMPSCSGATNALIWTASTGFGCNSIAAGGGSVNAGTAAQLGYYATSGNVISGTAGLAYVAGTPDTLTLGGSNGGNLVLGASGKAGTLAMGNATSGTLTLQPATGALGTNVITVPNATDTVALLAASQTLSNKIFVAPVLGAATATSINKVAITAPASSATLAIADGKTLTISNSVTVTATDGSTLAFGAGGTVTYTSNNLSVFASTTSAQLAGVISDETGTGPLVFSNNAVLVAPALGTPASGVATNLTGTAAGLTAGTVTTNANLSGPINSVGNLTSVNAQTGTGSVFVMQASPLITTPTISSGGVTFTGGSSGSTTLIAAAAASGTLTLPAATDTLVGKTTTDTLTNKTFDTAGSGNVFRINGTAISAVTGTASVVLSSGPTISSPTFSGTVAGAGTIPLTVLATQAANTVVGNATSGAASPTALAMPSCSGATSALTWTTSTGFGCNSISAGTGTVNSGTSGQLTYYAATGTTVSGTTSISVAGSGQLTVGDSSNFGRLGIVSQGSGTPTIIIANLTATSGYNFLLPSTVGSAGQPLLSAAGSDMTWGATSGSGAFVLVGSPSLTGTVTGSATYASVTLSNPTLTNTTTLPGSGSITSTAITPPGVLATLGPDTGLFGTAGLRLRATGTNAQPAVTVMPNGSATVASLRLYNADDATGTNVGYFTIGISGAAVSLNGGVSGSGVTPTQLATNLPLSVDGNRTVVSATAAVLDDFKVPNNTTTITGNTGSPITRLSKVSLYRPTLTDSSAVTVTDASTLYIENAPAASGSVTLTNTWALLVGSGSTKLQATTTGNLTIGAGSAITSSGAGGALGSNAFTSTAYAPLASPTFTGTVTGPDSGTWTSSGIRGVAQVRIGTSTLTSPFVLNTATNNNLRMRTAGGTTNYIENIADDGSTYEPLGLEASQLVIGDNTGGAGTIKFGSAAMFSANGAVVTVLGSIGPTGAHTTVQSWLTIQNGAGTTLYIPAF